MITETVNISELHPVEVNVRVHPVRQIEELARAVKMFGVTRPLIVDESNIILAGNGLFEACKQAGVGTVPVLRMSGLSENQKIKLQLSDNKVFELGIDHHANIMQLINELDGDFEIPGYDEELLRKLTEDVDKATEDTMNDFGRINENEEKQFRDEPITQGNEKEDISRVETTTCPRCGFVFV